ncbi:MAG: SRPBCC family protein, partial [Xanthomarina sp.]
MKYTTEILICTPVLDFVKKMQNLENLKYWQRGLISYDHISGVPGDVGSKMKLVYKVGTRQMELIETVIHKHFP